MTIFFGQFPFKIISNIRTNISFRHHSLLRRPKETSNKCSPYIILKANKDDYASIIKVMHETFYNEEPTCYTIGLHPNSIMDETAMQKMAEGITLVARCKYDGSVVGAVINESSNPWDPDLKEKLACNVQCPKMRHYLLFQAHAQRLPKIWDCLKVQKVFEIANIFVRSKAKDFNFLTRLMEESRSLAADCGYKIVRVNASTMKIAECCEKMNMKLQAEIPYCSYLGRDMVPIFKPLHPNESLKIYIDDRPQENASKFAKNKW